MADHRNAPAQPNRVHISHNGGFCVHWRGYIVFEKGRIKHFASEREAWDFLALCDTLGLVPPSK